MYPEEKAQRVAAIIGSTRPPRTRPVPKKERYAVKQKDTLAGIVAALRAMHKLTQKPVPTVQSRRKLEPVAARNLILTGGLRNAERRVIGSARFERDDGAKAMRGPQKTSSRQRFSEAPSDPCTRKRESDKGARGATRSTRRSGSCLPFRRCLASSSKPTPRVSLLMNAFQSSLRPNFLRDFEVTSEDWKRWSRLSNRRDKVGDGANGFPARSPR